MKEVPLKYQRMKAMAELKFGLLSDTTLLEDSDVFCMAPWTQIHVVAPGKVFPCCASGHRHDLAVGDLKKEGQTLETSWNSERMLRLRKDMIAGIKNELCERCHKYEELGKESERTWYNQQFGKYFQQVRKTGTDGTVKRFAPYYLDIRFSNTCNLKCRICLHELSSAWYSDSLQLGLISTDNQRTVYPTQKREQLWPQIKPLLKNLDRIHFAGGEPLMMDEHYMVLDELLRIGKTDIVITYNTNFSKLEFKRRDVLELWNKFEHVEVFASIDGSGQRGDYMRKGQSWAELENNRRRMMEKCPRIKFCINATVSLFNVMHVPDLYREWNEKGLIDSNDINLYLLFNPKHYSVQALPKGLKIKATEKYSEFESQYLSKLDTNVEKVKTHFRSIVEFMNEKDTEGEELKRFRAITEKLDTLREEEFEATFPELDSILKS